MLLQESLKSLKGLLTALMILSTFLFFTVTAFRRDAESQLTAELLVILNMLFQFDGSKVEIPTVINDRMQYTYEELGTRSPKSASLIDVLAHMNYEMSYIFGQQYCTNKKSAIPNWHDWTITIDDEECKEQRLVDVYLDAKRQLPFRTNDRTDSFIESHNTKTIRMPASYATFKDEYPQTTIGTHASLLDFLERITRSTARNQVNNYQTISIEREMEMQDGENALAKLNARILGEPKTDRLRLKIENSFLNKTYTLSADNTKHIRDAIDLNYRITAQREMSLWYTSFKELPDAYTTDEAINRLRQHLIRESGVALQDFALMVAFVEGGGEKLKSNNVNVPVVGASIPTNFLVVTLAIFLCGAIFWTTVTLAIIKSEIFNNNSDIPNSPLLWNTNYFGSGRAMSLINEIVKGAVILARCTLYLTPGILFLWILFSSHIAHTYLLSENFHNYLAFILVTALIVLGLLAVISEHSIRKKLRNDPQRRLQVPGQCAKQ